jgi:pterin-4a-carbinolamine dehydratase
MSKPVKLQGEERTKALKELQGWTEVKDRDAIFKQFKFKNFVEAWGFMTKVALEAEKVCRFFLRARTLKLTLGFPFSEN